MKKTATMQEVARQAGVSVASVSRVLSGNTPVADELQERVLAAVASIGYQPQRNHKSAEAVMPWLPVFVTTTVQQFHLLVIAGIQEQAEAKGWLTMIFRLTSFSEQLGRILHQMRMIPKAGLLSVGSEYEEVDWPRYYDDAQAPIVLLNAEARHPKIASILVNFEAAAAQATQHLLDLNHTRIVYLGDDRHPVASAHERGIRAAMARRGLELGDNWRVSVPMTPEGVSQGVNRIMNLPQAQRPTAIFAFDDEVAIDTLNALRYYGVRAPQDMSVIGFDNIPMSSHTYPPLTTVDVPKRRLGRQMVNLVDEVRRNEGSPFGATIVDAELIVRSSSGPAPSPSATG